MNTPFIPRPIEMPKLPGHDGELFNEAGRALLKCSKCGAEYFGDTPRVQRSMKQVLGKTRAKTERTTPKLCWVCVRLFVSAHIPDQQDLMYRHLHTGDE
jgi:hypothetical protein